MKKKKLAALIVVALLVAAIGIGATFAFMTKTSDTLENTFTVGNGINIALDEADYTGMTYDAAKGGYVDASGNLLPTDGRTSSGNSYTNILGGTEVTKDPTVTIENGSSSCYVFINVTGADALEALKDSTNAQAADVNGWSSSWHKVTATNGVDTTGNPTVTYSLADASDTTADGYYVYGTTVGGVFTPAVVDASEREVQLEAIFDTVEFSDNVSDVQDSISADGMGITVKACAVQSAAVADWAAAMAQCPATF